MELKHKKTILILIDWYVPGFKAGGPIKSIYSLVNFLKTDFNFKIITSDTDFNESVPYVSVESDKWIQLEESIAVFYASTAYLKASKILNLINSIQYDVIYLNSLFSKYFALYPLLFFKTRKIKKPFILAPRGMLGEGALKLKPLKKKVFLFFFKLSYIHLMIHWHATSEQEKEECIKVLGNKIRIFTVSNLQFNSKQLLLKDNKKEEGKVRLFFLSRISRKKNLLYALQVIFNLTLSNQQQIVFDIYGPIEENDYWEKCKPYMQGLNEHCVITYKGAVESDNVPEIMQLYDFLFLPTFNENFGHVIVEAFKNGKPVIISDQTPWKNLEHHTIGWDLPLNNNAKFESVLYNCVAMENAAYQIMSKNCIAYAQHYCDSVKDAEKMKQMFENVINHA